MWRMKHDPVPILTHAINVEGSAAALAVALNVAPSTVSNWRRRGLPLYVASDLVRRYARRKPKPSPLNWKPKEQQ